MNASPLQISRIWRWIGSSCSSQNPVSTTKHRYHILSNSDRWYKLPSRPHRGLGRTTRDLPGPVDGPGLIESFIEPQSPRPKSCTSFADGMRGTLSCQFLDRDRSPDNTGEASVLYSVCIACMTSSMDGSSRNRRFLPSVDSSRLAPSSSGAVAGESSTSKPRDRVSQNCSYKS